MVYSPPSILARVPDTPWGTMILCRTTGVSCTVPMMSPGTTLSPTLALGTKFHLSARLREGMDTPRCKLLPVAFMMSSSGRWMPSKMLPMRPGPSSTLMGDPVDSTGSPGPRPEVSS